MEKVVNVSKKQGIRPYFDIYIGRKVTAWGVKDFPEDSKWHNPYTVKEFGIDLSLKLYEKHIRNTPELWNALHELEGKVLGCWCINSQQNDKIICHGQILIKLLKERD